MKVKFLKKGDFDCRGRCGLNGKEGCNSTLGKYNNGYCCTLEEGHDGPHIACGLETCNMEAWERGKDE